MDFNNSQLNSAYPKLYLTQNSFDRAIDVGNRFTDVFSEALVAAEAVMDDQKIAKERQMMEDEQLMMQEGNVGEHQFRTREVQKYLTGYLPVVHTIDDVPTVNEELVGVVERASVLP